MELNVVFCLSIAQGIVVSGLNVVLTTWCVRMKGPLFVSFFNPLVVVIVALLASQTLDEKLHLGRYSVFYKQIRGFKFFHDL